MLDINKYKKMAGKDPYNSLNEQRVSDISKEINKSYENKVNAFEVLKNTDRSTEIYVNFGNEINKILIDYNRDLKKSDLSPYVKEIWSDHELLKTGDYITYTDKNGNINTFMVNMPVDVRDDYDLTYMQKCNYTLKWKNNLGNIISMPCIVNNTTMYSIGVDNEALFQTPDGKLSITLPDNEETRKIERDFRFIYKNRFAYKVTFPDISVDGLITLTLGESQPNPLDDPDDGIAYNEIDNISISLPQTSLSLTLGDSYTLQPTVYRNETVVLLPLVYSVDTPGIISISDDGVVTTIGEGNCVVSVSLRDNPNIKVDLVIDVVETLNNNITISMQGSDTIKQGSYSTYKAYVLNNGVIDETKTFVWSFAEVSSYASINNVQNNECVIKAGSTKGVTVILRAVCVELPHLIVEKFINIISIL